MTLPFENDTRAVIKKLAVKDMKTNRRTSLSIMAAILIASTFLCALFTFVQSYWDQEVQEEIYVSGDWDAQLLEISAGQLESIENDADVKKAMVKGNNQTALLPDGTALPYLLIQNCNTDYWSAMHEKNLILKGRIPQAPGEIVVGKNFFKENPSYQVGDTVTLSLGERKDGETVIDFLSPSQKGEAFSKSWEAEYTIVGEIDMTVSSAYNGYPAYGWLETLNLPKETGLVVYLQMRQPSNVFDAVPEIAKRIGLKMDEYRDYPYRYHTALLGLYGIYAPGKFLNSDLPKLFFALAMVAAASVAVFTYIIRGAFSISAKRKVKELGMLKAIGATPRQIRLFIIYEARGLSVIPLILSVGLGYLFSYGVLTAYSILTDKVVGSKLTVSFSPWAAILAMAFSFITVLLAASGPSKEMAKLFPIDAMRENWGSAKLKKSKKHPVLRKCFGFLGKLSANSISANKSLFRTCTVTLSLCMLLMFSFLALFAVSDINNTKAEQDNHFNVNITMETGQRVDTALMDELKKLPHVENQVTYAMTNCALWISESELSGDFLQSGGFNTKAAGEYIVERNGKYRVPCALIGLEEDAYQSCIAEADVDNSGKSSAVVVNFVVKDPDARGYEAKKDMTAYLNLSTGQSLELSEKFLDSIQGDYTFDLNVSTIRSTMPDIGRNFAFYTLPIIVPMEEYYNIIQNFQEDRAVYNYRTYMNLSAEDDMDAEVQYGADQVCSTYLSRNDFYTSSKTERIEDRKQLTAATMLIVYSLTALFGIVGISSAVSAILNSLYQRRKEFAMLRSVGLGRKGIRRLLGIEGFILAAKPTFFGFPILLFICIALVWMQDVTFAEFLTVFPLWGLIVYIVLVLVIIGGIYMLASRKMRKDIIIEVLRDETV